MAKKKTAEPAPTPAGFPSWIDVRGFLDAELKKRKQSLNSLTEIDRELSYSTIHTAFTKGEDAKWNTVLRIVAAMGMTMPDVLRKLAAPKSKAPAK